jgi:hypothetical protein
MSGRLDSAMRAEVAALGVTRALAKPFPISAIEELLAVVRA